MNITILIIPMILLLAVGGLALFAWLACRNAEAAIFANIGEGTFDGGRISRFSDEAIATRNLIVTQGNSDADVAICSATTAPLGFCTDTVVAADLTLQKVAVEVPGGLNRTALGVAAVSINTGDLLYTAAGGKVTNVPVPGCFVVGRALSDGASDDTVAIAPQRFGEPFLWSQRRTLGGGAPTEALTITGLTTAMVVQATILDVNGNTNLYLIEATVTADTLTLRFNEDPTDGVVMGIQITAPSVAAVDDGA